MSSDVYVRCHTCGATLNQRTNLPAGLQQLFLDLNAPVYDWNGQKGVDVLAKLANAIRSLETDDYHWRQEHCQASDDWDRVNFALSFLKDLRDAICQEPYSTVTVS